MRRALVTGGPGFIGRRVVQRLLDDGWNVTSLSLPGEAAAPEWSGPVRMVHGDITDPDVCTAAAERCRLLIHLAAPVGVSGRYDWQWRVLADGTRNLCAGIARQGGRAVVASSIAVYGSRIQSGLCREDDGFGPWQGAYGRAKQGQETAALEVAAATGMPLTLIRPANVYGLGGQSAWGDRLIRAIAETGGAVFGAADRNNAGLVHVENLADAILLAATDPRAKGRTYNVCDGEDVTWRRFMDDLAAIASRAPPPLFPLADALALIAANEDPSTCREPADPALPSMEGLNLVGYDNRIDASRIRDELGWRPGITYADAIRAIAADWSARCGG